MLEQGVGLHPPPVPTTPRLAPWDAVQELTNRLNRLITLLESLLALQEVGVPGVPGLPVPGVPGVPGVLEIHTPWVAGPIQTILEQTAILVVGTTNTSLVSLQKGKRLIVKVTSTLDQALIVQVVGNIDNSMIGAVNIDGPLPCAAFSNITVGLAWDDWHPFVGIVLTHAVAPTVGTVKVEAVVQE